MIGLDRTSTVVHLRPAMFGEAEHLLISAPETEIRTFRYASGVEALRLVTPRTELIVLPFRGQQIWRYRVDGEDLTMHTHFDEPTVSRVFGETYGAFLLHCGLTGIGAPGPRDSHAHHGELPNARYSEARLLLERSDGADVVSLTGTHRMRVSHSTDVEFLPRVSVHSDTTAIDVNVRLRNRRVNPFTYSYLCHVNWALPETAQLVQPVPFDTEHFRLAPHPQQDEPTANLTARIERDPAVGDLVTAETPVAPEYCAVLRPIPDPGGWAHFLMLRPDGRAASVSYETAELGYAIRWISNTGDEQAAGFCLPATAPHFGRTAAEADGLLRVLPGNSEAAFRIVIDLLEPSAAADRLARIEAILVN